VFIKIEWLLILEYGLTTIYVDYLLFFVGSGVLNPLFTFHPQKNVDCPQKKTKPPQTPFWRLLQL